MIDTQTFNNPISLKGFATAPTNVEEGMIYFNSTMQSFYKYENGAFTKDISQTDLLNYYTKAEIDALTTTAIAEGVNLYFTEARAKAAAVVNSTAGNETDQAPSVSAVKAYVSSNLADYYTKIETDDLLDDKADQTDLLQEIQDREDADALLIPLAQKGAINGVATLDAGGKVPVSQLPNSVMELQGTYNATTNVPSLIDGTGNAGDVYEVTVAGTQDFGNGNIEFAVGDWVVYAADGKWYKSINSNEVTLVNGKKGVVVLDTDDIDEGAVNKYYASSLFDADLATKDTDDLDEGSSNLYFTNGRAQTASVVDSTAGNETVQAPSVSAVKSYVNAQGFLKNIVEDITPELGGNLDVGTHKILTAQNSIVVQSAQNTVVRSNGTTSIQDKYIASVALSASQTDATMSAFTVPFASIDSMIISYRIKDSSGGLRVGTILVATDGVSATLSDTFNSTINTGVIFSAALSGANLIIRYTSGVKTATLSADVKQFLV